MVSDKSNQFSLSIKRKVCDKWDELDLGAELKSISHAEVLIKSLEGQEAVAQLKKGRKTVYLCGTDALKKKMTSKGTVTSFTAGLEYMREHRILPKLIEAVNQPILLEALEVFKGAIVSEVEIDLAAT